MNMIRHDHRCVKLKNLAVAFQACVQNDISRSRSQQRALSSRERDEVSFICPLSMRQFATIFVFALHLARLTESSRESCDVRTWSKFVLHGRGRPCLHVVA